MGSSLSLGIQSIAFKINVCMCLTFIPCKVPNTSDILVSIASLMTPCKRVVVVLHAVMKPFAILKWRN